MSLPIRFAIPFFAGRAAGISGALVQGGGRARDIYLCQGYFDFPVGRRFVESLYQVGHQAHLVLFGRGLASRISRSWKTNLARLVRNLLVDPQGPTRHSLFVGHSQGGLVVSGLGTIAKSNHLEAIGEVIPQFRAAGLATTDLRRAQSLLRAREVRFVSVATPFKGLEAKEPLATLADLAESSPWVSPLNDCRGWELRRFYNAARLEPIESVDGNLYGVCEALDGVQRPTTLVVRSCMMAGAKILFAGGRGVTRSDCLLLEETMRLGHVNEVVLPNVDHWMIVKLRRAARGLLQVIQRL